MTAAEIAQRIADIREQLEQHLDDPGGFGLADAIDRLTTLETEITGGEVELS